MPVIFIFVLKKKWFKFICNWFNLIKLKKKLYLKFKKIILNASLLINLIKKTQTTVAVFISPEHSEGLYISTQYDSMSAHLIIWVDADWLHK